MFIEHVTATGRLVIQLFDKDGNMKDERHLENMVVTAGKGYIAARIATAATLVSHIAIGSGSTAPTLADTALGSELGRAVITSSTSAAAVATFVSTLGPGVGTGAVTEAGVFNNSSGGTMLCRTIFAVVNKDVNDTMIVTWLITIN